MPEFIAVQCFDCHRYQVSQKRKDSKFVCKLCGKKQSVRKILARSERAADVRKVVQKANLARGEAEEQCEERELEKESTQENERKEIKFVPAAQSRWQHLADDAVEEESDDDDALVTTLPDRYIIKGAKKPRKDKKKRTRQAQDTESGFERPAKGSKRNRLAQTSSRWNTSNFPLETTPPLTTPSTNFDHPSTTLGTDTPIDDEITY